MGHVYLIGEDDDGYRFKIGSTRHDDVGKRLRQLQTGNSSRLIIRDSFETSEPFKLEQMLHFRLKDKKVINEWFELDEDDVSNFKPMCEKLQAIIDSLNGNPFYNRKKDKK
jgi:hypothetical protein